MNLITIITKILRNKTIKNLCQKRRGPKGYGFLKIARMLVYMTMRKIWSTRKLIIHLENNPEVLRQLKFKQCPCRRTIDNWKKDYPELLQVLIQEIGDQYLAVHRSEWTLIDSTKIEDLNDPDSKKGYTSQGGFWGFKLHIGCDVCKMPLRAVFTDGNIHDSKPAFQLLAPTPKVGGDSAYDAKCIKSAILHLGVFPIFHIILDVPAGISVCQLIRNYVKSGYL